MDRSASSRTAQRGYIPPAPPARYSYPGPAPRYTNPQSSSYGGDAYTRRSCFRFTLLTDISHTFFLKPFLIMHCNLLTPQQISKLWQTCIDVGEALDAVLFPCPAQALQREFRGTPGVKHHPRCQQCPIACITLSIGVIYLCADMGDVRSPAGRLDVRGCGLFMRVLAWGVRTFPDRAI